MLTTATLFEALERRRAKLGLSQAEVGRRAFGRSDSSALQNIKRGSAPTWDNLNALCTALGLVIRIDPKEDLLSGLAEPAAHNDVADINGLRAGYLPIPWHDAARRRLASPIAFLGEWFAAQGLSPDSLRAIVPDRLAMQVARPTDTIALLDVSEALKGSGALWAMLDGGQLVVRRIAFGDKVIVLYPDNENDEPVRIIDRPAPAGFSLLGRVVWLGLLPKP